MRCVLALLCCLASIGAARAEPFMGISYGHRLSDVKGLFPNAKVEDGKPAWLQPHQRITQFTGLGITGTLVVRMDHEVEALQRFVMRIASKQANGGTLTDTEAMYLRDIPPVIERKRADPPDDPWQVVEIRWVPESPIPMKALVSRYGPDFKDSVNEKFERSLEWATRGVEADMRDDQATMLTFSFTAGEMVCADRKKAGEACDPLTVLHKPSPSRPAPRK